MDETSEEELPVEEEESASAISRRVPGQLRDMPVDNLAETAPRLNR
ncbi:MAG: hypothetical protein JRH18_15465 [Deltaproteobacteria bacterium]|nr:hypothetical protein [Deltaproteobacteria bacterium]MBW2153055.1 hypothetical protein [Deltaproteobacteria bacterium]